MAIDDAAGAVVLPVEATGGGEGREDRTLRREDVEDIFAFGCSNVFIVIFPLIDLFIIYRGY